MKRILKVMGILLVIILASFFIFRKPQQQVEINNTELNWEIEVIKETDILYDFKHNCFGKTLGNTQELNDAYIIMIRNQDIVSSLNKEINGLCTVYIVYSSYEFGPFLPRQSFPAKYLVRENIFNQLASLVSEHKNKYVDGDYTFLIVIPHGTTEDKGHANKTFCSIDLSDSNFTFKDEALGEDMEWIRSDEFYINNYNYFFETDVTNEFYNKYPLHKKYKINEEVELYVVGIDMFSDYENVYTLEQAIEKFNVKEALE